MLPLKNSLAIIACLFLSLLFACETKEDLNYTVPSSYSFENVYYQGQIDRLAMLIEMKAYLNSTKDGSTIDANRLQAMYENNAAAAGFTKVYTKDIKSKTFPNEQATFEALFQAIATASQSNTPAQKNQAGLVNSLDGSKTYLLGANGLEYAQLIEKGLMGACFYYQATAIYLGEDRMNADNDMVTPGEGTDMEHHWDEAFGYFGAPKDFPDNREGIVFWASYSDKRNQILGSNEKLMSALIKGRAAISNKDLETRDEAINEVRTNWEQISATTALHYLNETIANFDDLAIRSHALSEGLGFVYALQFNPGKTIDNTQIRALLELMGGAPDFSAMNLYEVTKQDLIQARTDLAAYYGFSKQMETF